MLISELIQQLELLKAEHGDLPIYCNDSEFGEEPAEHVTFLENSLSFWRRKDDIKRVLIE